MTRLSSLAALLLLTGGCAPQSAELVDGSFTAYLSNTTSLTVAGGKVDLQGTEQHWAVDCRELQEGQTALEEALPICADPLWPPAQEGWFSRDAYFVQQEPLVPWRGEAIMTSEGDLQIAFHHKVTGGEDMRFAFVIDPGFQPNKCTELEDGSGTRYEPVDGDWVANWSDPTWTTLPGDGALEGNVYFLNARSYQFDPANLDSVWSLPLEWRAGFANAKFGEEKMVMRTTRYGNPFAYTRFESEEITELSRDDLFYVTLPEGTDPATSPEFQAMCDQVHAVADQVEAEFALTGVTYRPAVHCNGWRPADGRPSGLDAWGELDYNWVRIDQSPASIEVGAPVTGEFSLLFDGEQTQSRLLLRGSFTVDRIKRDKWVTDDIEAIKMEENGTVLCGESTAE
ncbi:MAG: hypothetical protein JXX28_17435 [Deltaproteobacteria bacterium]|nr:hypothetical protein [Deltaproteobacteria bacterium]